MSVPSHNKTLIIWILGALATVTPFAIDLYLPAFSQIASDFNTTTATVSLSVSSYFIGMAIGQILYGPLLDRFGRKPPLYAGVFLFITASIFCMQSTSSDMLILFRFVQAIGGSVAWVAAVAMVRDFFPVEESSKVFSLLILIIGVSPLLAPTVGGFITTSLGWPSVFLVLALLALFTISLVFFFLPEGHKPDPTVSLKPAPMINTFWGILKTPQFYTYSFTGAFSFASLFVYVAGSPVIFLEKFQISPQGYGGIFALLSVGFIGGSQLNIFLTKKYRSDTIIRAMMTTQFIATIAFLVFALNGWLDLYSTLFFFFICLSCIGMINPNANALAIAPFTRNVGSASALMGCTQIGVAALASTGVGLFNSKDEMPVVILMAVTCTIAFVVRILGSRAMGNQIITSDASPQHASH